MKANIFGFVLVFRQNRGGKEERRDDVPRVAEICLWTFWADTGLRWAALPSAA